MSGWCPGYWHPFWPAGSNDHKWLVLTDRQLMPPAVGTPSVGLRRHEGVVPLPWREQESQAASARRLLAFVWEQG